MYNMIMLSYHLIPISINAYSIEEHEENKPQNLLDTFINVVQTIYDNVYKIFVFIQRYIPLDIIIIGFFALINFQVLSIGIIMSVLYMLLLMLMLYYGRKTNLFQNLLIKLRNLNLNFPFENLILSHLDMLIQIIITIVFIYVICVLNFILSLILSIFFWLIVIMVGIILLYTIIAKLFVIYKKYNKRIEI